MVSRSDSNGNGLLAHLSVDEPERLLPFLQLVPLKFSETLYEAGQTITSLYFPTTGVVSMLRPLGDGTFVEVSLVGSEGVVGLPVFLGGEASSNRAVVQVAGEAWIAPAALLYEEFKLAGAFHDAVLRYVYYQLLQVAQTASCNRHHPVNERLSRWLLMLHDRVTGDSIQMRQEFLAWMLGVTLGSVSLAAIDLQEAGLIEYRRGRIVIADRKRLEEKTCSCYRIVKVHFDSLLSISPA